MKAKELVKAVVERQMAEFDASVELSEADPAVAMMHFVTGIRIGAFNAGMLCGMGAIRTVGVDASEATR